jgi:hypothetical protein
MSTPANPYASYGGSVAPDPYAAYGGMKADAAVSPEQLDALKKQNAINDATHFGTSVDEKDNAVLNGVANAGGATAGPGANPGQIVGGAKSFLQPAVTISKLLHKGGDAIYPGLGEAIAPQSGIDRMDNATQTRGTNEDEGQILENIAEFAIGEEALKGLSLSQKLTKMAPIVKQLEKYPKLAHALGAAMRQGTVATGQGLAHGEDAGTALEQGGVTALTGVAFEGLSRGASKFLQRNAATLEKVGGVDTTIPAEVRNAKPTPQQTAGQEAVRNAAQNTLSQHLENVNASRRVPKGPLALPERTGPYEFQIKGLQPAEAESGEMVVPAAEMPRDRITGLPENAPAGSESARNRAELGSTAETVPPRLMRDQPYMTSPAEGAEPHSVDNPKGGGVLKTTDADAVKRHLGTMNEVINHESFGKLPAEQQNAILEHRADVQRQLGEYHRHMEQFNPNLNQPHLPQIDVPRVVKQVGSYTEAASHLEKVATDGYNAISDALQLNDISGGKFATIRNANREAWNAYKGASSVEAMTTAEHAIDETNRQMESLLKNDISGAISQSELDGFNRAYGSAQKLKYVANAVDSSFSGNASAGARSWEYRGFDGNKLMSNLNRLEQKFGRTSLESTVGRDNLNTLYQVANLNRTNASRAKFGVALHPIAQWLDSAGGAFSHLAPIAIGGEIGRATGIGWGLGATAGEGLALATKRVMNAVLSNPKIAQNLIFAIDSGARPQNYAPIIGAMVQSMERSKDKLIKAGASMAASLQGSKQEDKTQ